MRMNNPVIRTAMLLFLVIAPMAGQSSLRQALQMSAPLISSNEPGRLMVGEQENSKKSVLLGVAYSLILPGLGDFYARKTEIGKYYLGADVALWLAYGGVQSYGHWVKNDARTFAVQKAGANFSDKQAQYEVDLGNFNNVDDYNQAKLRNRQFDLVYDAASTYAWKWTSEADRLIFKNERIRGDEILRNSQFVVGALVINRIVAAISAARSVSDYNRNVQSLGGWRVNAGAMGGLFAADGINLTVSKDF